MKLIFNPWIYNSSSFVIIKRGRLLAQRPITLVLMMINSCSYNINDLVLIKFQILNQDLSRCLALTRDSNQVLKLAYIDSRAFALRSHQALKEKSSSWIKFGSRQDGVKDFQEKT